MSIDFNDKSGDRISLRAKQELAILEKVTSAKNIKVGIKTIDDRAYTAIIIKGVALSSRKFKVSNTDLLFLLPPDYPRFPPIGCYLNFPWNTVGQGDHHFTLQSHYGAPFLSNSGWYWYCVGLGGGFRQHSWHNSWRPGSSADNGHNLATLFVTARHAINTDD